jgi:hypothetical protein
MRPTNFIPLSDGGEKPDEVPQEAYPVLYPQNNDQEPLCRVTCKAFSLAPFISFKIGSAQSASSMGSPEMKSAELAKGEERRKQAEQALQSAIEGGNEEETDRFSLDPVHVKECQRLVTLLGLLFVETEAECAALADATPILPRHLSYRAGAGKDVIAIAVTQFAE